MDERSAVGYCRVSTREQGDSGLGLEAQREAIEHACAARGWHLLAIHEDVISGGKAFASRSGVKAALLAVTSGAADILIVSKLDRLSRSLLDFAALMEEARGAGWNLVALDLGVDLSTPAGEFVANILMNVAQWERQIISVRIRDALAIKKAHGFKLGRTDVITPEVVARIVAMSADGLGFSAVARVLNEEGVPTAQGGARWYASTIRSVLHRYHSPTPT